LDQADSSADFALGKPHVRAAWGTAHLRRVDGRPGAVDELRHIGAVSTHTRKPVSGLRQSDRDEGPRVQLDAVQQSNQSRTVDVDLADSTPQRRVDEQRQAVRGRHDHVERVGHRQSGRTPAVGDRPASHLSAVTAIQPSNHPTTPVGHVQTPVTWTGRHVGHGVGVAERYDREQTTAGDR